MSLLLFLAVGLFSLKIIWNIGLVYDLAWRLLKTKAEKTGGVSFMPMVEIALLLLAIGASAIAKGSTWFHSPKHVAIFGVVAIVGSYVHFIIMGMFFGWIISLIKKKQK